MKGPWYAVGPDKGPWKVAFVDNLSREQRAMWAAKPLDVATPYDAERIVWALAYQEPTRARERCAEALHDAGAIRSAARSRTAEAGALYLGLAVLFTSDGPPDDRAGQIALHWLRALAALEGVDLPRALWSRGSARPEPARHAG